MVLIFPNLCLWRRSLRSNLGGIDPDKLYRATLKIPKPEIKRDKKMKKTVYNLLLYFAVLFAPDRHTFP